MNIGAFFRKCVFLASIKRRYSNIYTYTYMLFTKSTSIYIYRFPHNIYTYTLSTHSWNIHWDFAVKKKRKKKLIVRFNKLDRILWFFFHFSKATEEFYNVTCGQFPLNTHKYTVQQTFPFAFSNDDVKHTKWGFPSRLPSWGETGEPMIADRRWVQSTCHTIHILSFYNTLTCLVFFFFFLFLCFLLPWMPLSHLSCIFFPSFMEPQMVHIHEGLQSNFARLYKRASL